MLTAGDDSSQQQSLDEFNDIMELQQHKIIKDSLSLIDRQNFLLNVIKSKGLLKLSPEILKINSFAQLIHKKEH